MISRSLRRSINIRLLRWFDRHARSLPWRKDRDPYRIWVSEIMLQQTTVAAVVGYFERFIAAFPDWHSLAAADEQDVLHLWQGLGYYRRARFLHRAAQQIVRDFDGQVPADIHSLSQLPGIGRYSAGAILSQAFDLRLPIVEANSLRVLCRLFAYQMDPRNSQGQRWLWAKAEELLPDERVGDFNQALMELGATVCTPSKPRCGECPLAKHCMAHGAGMEERIPVLPRKPKVTIVPETALAIRKGNLVLMAQRPAGGRWEGMWEFPRLDVRPTPRVCRDAIGLEVRGISHLGSVRHRVTRFEIHVECYEATRVSGRVRLPNHAAIRWVAPDELGDYPAGTAQRRLNRFVIAKSREGISRD